MAQITDAWFYRLKAAQRDLIKISGGIERAAEITSISKSHVGRWNNAGDTDLMPINAVLLLESECGAPLVTSVMADLNGRRLSDPEDAASSGNVFVKHAETMRQASELMAVGALASADGKLTRAEAVELDRAAAELDRANAAFRKELAGARASGGFAVVEGGK
jgi:hypothetical protein